MSNFYDFLEDGVSFRSDVAGRYLRTYMPLCGTTESSIKSCITPFLSGDIKLNKNVYITKPTSREDLIYPVRSIFVQLNGRDIISTVDLTIHPKIYAGQLWYRTIRDYSSYGFQVETMNFIPISGENVELMEIIVRNVSDKPVDCQMTFAIPLFCRSLENKHDHEHVTSLLNRIKQSKDGICVCPTMKFNEEGHKINRDYYFVFGRSEDGWSPNGSFPTTDSFYGHCSNMFYPESLYKNQATQLLPDKDLIAKEAMGSLQFSVISLDPNEEKKYIINIGVANNSKEIDVIFKKFSDLKNFQLAFDNNKNFWKKKTDSLQFYTGNQNYNHWLKWVLLQPILRRIYGCSFLPDHDYGKGGKGWRDIWQDLLSLIIIEPESIRYILVNNFSGVRMDGSNATIIGTGSNQFIADRNSISRVWMDHGVWPYLTLKLYINQTGDTEILFEKVAYFQDGQFFRGKKKYFNDTPRDVQQRTKTGDVYCGCILEHILIELLVPFFHVGEHNIIKLENADWNDGLDMAANRGESVCFTFLYGRALRDMADLLKYVSLNHPNRTFSISKEVSSIILIQDESIFDSIDKKRDILRDYFNSITPTVSGETVEWSIEDLIDGLNSKYCWIKKHLIRQEWVQFKGFHWFNGYYDNRGIAVEGDYNQTICMTLPGQVFSIMSGMLSEEEVKKIIKSVDCFLKDEIFKGYRLNTNFKKDVYLDLGRAFGFGYGTKENGAFFSHMIVMYAYALYQQRFGEKAYHVMQSIYNMSNQFSESCLYPGVPEYIDGGTGMGMYSYLTGAASWWVLTEMTQSFGIRGENGDLVMDPQLVLEQFNEVGIASAVFSFNNARIKLIYHNDHKLDVSKYTIGEIWIDGVRFLKYKKQDPYISIPRSYLLNGDMKIDVYLHVKN